jgi:transposase
MSETPTIETERVDDIPILIAQMKIMGLDIMFDKHFPAHGNWQGLSPGNVVAVWLSHILSEGDHRMNQVQPWAARRLETLSGCVREAVAELDVSDDRLASLLNSLGKNECWSAFEVELNRQLLRVYDLRAERIRLDSTTASGYWTVNEDGLFQFGYSKDRRGNQPQLKVMLSTLDPLGLPLVTQVVSGQRSDDPLYVPAIQQVQAALGRGGLLYVGDCKMPSQNTRAFVQASGDYYLGPLSQSQLSHEEMYALLDPLPALELIYRTDREGRQEAIADGFEHRVEMHVAQAEQTITWTERRLVVRSFLHLANEQEGLEKRLQKAEKALEALTEYNRKGKKRFQELDPLQAKAAAILQRYEVVGLLPVEYIEEVPEGWARYKMKRQYRIKVGRDTAAIQKAVSRLGWRVYATNMPIEQLSMEQAVQAYREEYQIEHNFARLKGKTLSLSPMYLQDNTRAAGLVRLLSIALRILTLLEFVVRRKLAEQTRSLPGLFAGNPMRETSRPTAEAILKAFKEINLTSVSMGEQVYYHVSPLSALQQTILSLLGFPPDLFSRLTRPSANSP